jgi:ADP-ribose pyrophosphatase YjhB (NUDIX family)
MAQQARVCNVIIERDDKYLLVQEAKAKAYKLWNFPGGHVEPGETLEVAAAREVHEETGYIVTILEQILIRENHNGAVLAHTYLAKIVGGALRLPPDEILDAKWFSYEEIITMKDMRDLEYNVMAIKATQK